MERQDMLLPDVGYDYQAAKCSYVMGIIIPTSESDEDGGK